MHPAAALDHQPPYAAVVEVLGQPAHLHPAAAVDDGRHRATGGSRAVRTDRAGAVDELLAVTDREEVAARVEPGVPRSR